MGLRTQRRCVKIAGSGDGVDTAMALTGGHVLRSPSPLQRRRPGGEYDSYRALDTVTLRRLTGAGLVSSAGSPPDELAGMIADRGGPGLNADDCVSWYVKTCLAGLDARAGNNRAARDDVRREAAHYAELAECRYCGIEPRCRCARSGWAARPERLSPDQRNVLDNLRRAAGGLTDWEHAPLLQTSAGKRRGELVRAGLAVAAGDKRLNRHDGTGRPVTVWHLTPVGVALADTLARKVTV